jgi:hypothetical protein
MCSGGGGQCTRGGQHGRGSAGSSRGHPGRVGRWHAHVHRDAARVPRGAAPAADPRPHRTQQVHSLSLLPIKLPRRGVSPPWVRYSRACARAGSAGNRPTAGCTFTDPCPRVCGRCLRPPSSSWLCPLRCSAPSSKPEPHPPSRESPQEDSHAVHSVLTLRLHYRGRVSRLTFAELEAPDTPVRGEKKRERERERERVSP